ncbi:integrase-like protein [Mucilaginibacter yixingensis]|uniref:Integrase-like protein n=1 Tax=Mucilaginibacter yixingensis TaxID=1295612 RepID=A0A2T5J5J0_9SPHI|nr:site-specific integrase [Mucilaginibacter yixingensis]PTQ93253.1 integrase-like protein [Mucilaginibacter yixingensis]
MVQLKIVLDTRRQKSDGTYPITFRVTDVKKVLYIQFGTSVLADMWDIEQRTIRKNHPNALLLNTALSKKFYQIQKAIKDLVEDGNFSFDTLKQCINSSSEIKKAKPILPSFKTYADKLIADLYKSKKIGNAIVYKTATNRLIKYTNPNLKFIEINYQLLDEFKNHLLSSEVKINSISNYLRTIRAIYNKAIKAKIIDRSHYPFHDTTIKTEKTAKRAITKQDIHTIENLPLKVGSKEWHARNYFLLSFYLIGISFTDLAYLTSKNVVNGRVEFRRRKTHKLYSIKLFSQAYTILNVYSKTENKYLLPVLPNSIEEDTLESKKLIYQWIKTTNKFLKRVGGDMVTTYVARHTWATSAKRLGYSNELIAEAMGHEYGNKITNIYLDSFDKEVIDKMHLEVIRR